MIFTTAYVSHKMPAKTKHVLSSPWVIEEYKYKSLFSNHVLAPGEYRSKHTIVSIIQYALIRNKKETVVNYYYYLLPYTIVRYRFEYAHY